mmetsp:Transcript_57731/g.80124  ORF Transcript_57731/g.80124 Transcript_57731/m.80124 type:complete len:189 (+) Transcript_57731:61-627(+)
MTWCERRLNAHVDCVKGFLREARENETPYAPGTYNEYDKCGDTRQAYVNCTHGPKQKVGKQVINQVSTQAQPLDFYKQQAHSGRVGATDSEPLPTLLHSRHGPRTCEMELSVHGKCVENYLRNSMTKGTDYIFLSQDGEDKCFNSRAAFDQCVRGTKDLNAGKKHEKHPGPPESLKVAKHFSLAGSWE